MSPIRRAIFRLQLSAFAIVFLMLGGTATWMAMADISGAVVAPSVVAVEGHPKKVQHLEGGVVAEIAVRNGDRVRAGDLLLRLDETEIRASVQIFTAQLEEIRARRARLMAERDGLDHMPIPTGEDAPKGSEAITVWEGQQKLLLARAEARNGKKKQLTERIGQLEQAILGLNAQAEAKEEQLQLIDRELKSLRVLEKQQLVTQTRVLALEREFAKLRGERAQLIFEAARTGVQIGETRLQLLEVDQSFMSEVLAELREIEVRIIELTEKLAAAKARLQRTAIVAPRAGIVHKLEVHTIGGVISPGESILEIVPEDDRLVLDGRIDPTQVDQVKAGQEVTVRFSAFDQRTTPELMGTVILVAPDVRQDNPQSPPYFLARVALRDGELEKIGDKKLQPGMPADLFIKTGERTALSYLVRPLTDQIKRAFREE